MRDKDVRDALHVQLLGEHASELADTLFVDELGLCGEVRVDVAVVNGSLSGYELKSARDTLRRLPTQVEVYSRVLDYATLVVAENHVDHAKGILPAWWGLIEAKGDVGSVSLVGRRHAAQNPAVDPESLAQLLWRSEALRELETRGLAAGVRSKPRVEIWRRLATELAIEDLRAVVRACLKARQDWRSAAPSS
ncbi:sce7726 family protein [Nocardioides sp. MH1]|uniref:sce7726 family protein n=1 Tax=Nocardioides sp. MH1 TaxID=3242490 RepID=UPI0035209A38